MLARLFAAPLAVATLGSAASAQGPPWKPLDSATTAFIGVNVIPMTRDSVLLNHTVIVSAGRITSVGPVRSTAVPRGARRIDGRNRWLIPGLADAHVHLPYFADSVATPTLLRLFVAEGVTTVVNLLGLPEHLKLRERVASGDLLGPLIATSGYYVGAPFATTVAQVDSLVRKQRADGFDMVKLHGNISAEAYAALLAAGQREGMRVVGHLPRNLGLTAAVEGRQHMIAHAEEYLYGWFGFVRSPQTRESVLALVDSAARLTACGGMWVTPTLRVFAGIPAQKERLDSVLATPAMQRIPERVKRRWQPANNQYRMLTPAAVEAIGNQALLLRRLTLALHQADVPLLMGTDAMATAAVLPGTSAHEELQELVQAGLSSLAALKTATVNVAKFLGIPSEFGVVGPGYRADLLLLDANPLEDIRATSRIAGVMLRGRWFDAAALQSLRETPPD